MCSTSSAEFALPACLLGVQAEFDRPHVFPVREALATGLGALGTLEWFNATLSKEADDIS